MKYEQIKKIIYLANKLFELGAMEDFYRLERSVLKKNDAELSLEFACQVKWSNLKSHQKIVVKNQNLDYNYRFAKDVYCANIKVHEDVIIKSKNVDACYEFAKNVKGADVLALGKVVLDYGDENENYKFSKLKGADKDSHLDKIVELKKFGRQSKTTIEDDKEKENKDDKEENEAKEIVM